MKQIAATLDNQKAEDIVIIPLKGKSDMADYMVIASGRSARHVASLADYVNKTLGENGVQDAHVEGMATADWVLVDSFQVIVHLFRPEVRSFYNLERMWDVPAPTPSTPAPRDRGETASPARGPVHIGGFAGQMA